LTVTKVQPSTNLPEISFNGHYIAPLALQLQVSKLLSMKYKCVNSECQEWGKDSLIQLFFKSSGELSYGRARHYLGHRQGKPQFEYHPQNLDALKDLLKTEGISVTTEKAISGQLGQSQSKKVYDLKSHETSLNQENICGRRLVWFRTLAFQANDHGFKSRQPHFCSEQILTWVDVEKFSLN
jgi:hypothetical protein